MRTTLLGLLLMIGSVSLGQASETTPIVGAIRWDAWTGGDVTKEVERSLGPEKYHFRLPWFAEVRNDNLVRIDGSPQEIMDREIDFAADAGLDYWAFVLYPESNSMSQALKQYLKSANRNRLKFCVILHNAFGVSDEQWPGERDRVVTLMKDPRYQTVRDGRPLVFAFAVQFRGSFPTSRFAEFRNAAHKAGVNPYCVFMGWDPGLDYRSESTNGFDAVSAYAYGSELPTFAKLVHAVEKDYWQNAATTHARYVPLVTTGWDKQPRKDHPVSWELNQSYHHQAVFPSTATPEEIAGHLKQAVLFVREHPQICVANAVIVYAWNEYDEGGWLAPTWTPSGKPNTERLEAIRKILPSNPGR